MRVVFVWKKEWDIGLLLDLLGFAFFEVNLPFFEVGKDHIDWLIFWSMPKQNSKKWIVNYTTLLNFEKFHKARPRWPWTTGVMVVRYPNQLVWLRIWYLAPIGSLPCVKSTSLLDGNPHRVFPIQACDKTKQNKNCTRRSLIQNLMRLR